MQTVAGTRFGPYEIISLVGAGGMGEVYRARDTRLGRDVAIKLLAPALAADENAIGRFEREARAVAAISHPNIVALHDVGRDGSTAYVVTELLEGSSLRERLAEGPLPLRKVIDYGNQIANALAAAHERGIVHRDIKPDNIFITNDGRAKVLDFGLAHVVAPTPDAQTGTMVKEVNTAPGTFFGTAGYIAPEQLRGRDADHRSDIFSFGAVLYEMVSGRRAFPGETFADSMHAILHNDPPPIADGAAAHLERAVRRCLEKEPGERFQSARDLAFVIRAETSVASGPLPTAGVPSARWRGLVAGAVLLLALAVAAILLLRPRSTTATAGPVVRFGMFASPTWSDSVSISPDGKYIVFSSGAEPGTATSTRAVTDDPGAAATGSDVFTGRFWLRRLDAVGSRAIALSDTKEAFALFFWSPDSRYLGYRSSGDTLSIRDVTGGPPRPIGDLQGTPQGVAWGKDGTLLVAAPGGIYRMQADGGRAKLVLGSDPGKELWRGSPSFLPDGKRFVFTVLKNGTGDQALETRVASLDGTDLGAVATGIVGALHADGCLVFGAGGALYAQPFDSERLRLYSNRVQLAPSVAQDWRAGRLDARVSDNGVLVYRRSPRGNSQFVLVDRFGRRVRDIGSADSFTNFSVSPNDQRIIAVRSDPVTGRHALWLIDMARGVTSPVTASSDSEDADDPTWMPDGEHVAYLHGSRVVVRAANGGPERTVVSAVGYPDSVSRDGRFLIFGQTRGNGFEQSAIDIMIPGAKAIPLLTGVTLADEGRMSPNGRWVAAHSNATGTPQITIVPFPPTGESWQISQNGGVQPRWSAGGDELFYLDPDGHLMSVRIAGSDPRKAAAAEVMFATGVVPSDALDQFAPLRNGFVIRTPARGGGDATAVQVIVNWKELIH